jgi:hypothetical protein
MSFEIVSPPTRSQATDTALERLESQQPTKDAASDADASRYPVADALVCVTARHWGGDSQASTDTRVVADYAIGRVRDLFLTALDEADPGRTLEIARHLVCCGNPLPYATCVALGLPPGSSYGEGARAVLAKAGGS